MPAAHSDVLGDRCNPPPAARIQRDRRNGRTATPPAVKRASDIGSDIRPQGYS